MWLLFYLCTALLSQVFGEESLNLAFFEINSKMASQSIVIADIYPEARGHSSYHHPSGAICNDGTVYGPSSFAWCALENNPPNQWYELDALKPIKIYGIATRGRCGCNCQQFVRTYKVYHSGDGVIWTPVDGGKEFQGNTDECGIVQNLFGVPIVARYIHIHPYSYNVHMSMRAALLIESALWNDEMQNVDSDPYKDARTASSCWENVCNAETNPHHFTSWLTGEIGKAWCAGQNNPPNQWYQIDLLTVQKVYGTVITGRGLYDQFVTSYTVEYSHDGVTFHNVDGGNVFKGVTGDKQLNRFRNNFAHPIPARFIKIRPQSFNGHISMKAGLRLEGAVNTMLSTRECFIWGDPHNMDWSGRQYDFMGIGDFLVADIAGYRIETEMYPCNGPITCQKAFAIVTPTGRIIEFNINGQDSVYDKNAEVGSALPMNHEIDGLLLKMEGPNYRLFGETFDLFVWHNNREMNTKIWNKKFPSNVGIKGGLCTGTIKNAANVYPGINAPGAFQNPDVNQMGQSWKLSPEESHIINTKRLMKAGKAAVERYWNAHQAGQQQYSEASQAFAIQCCAPVKRRQAECGFAEQIYLGCIMDHRKMKTANGGAGCQNLNFMDDLCPRRPKSIAIPGCVGDWTPFGICTIKNGKCVRTHTYRITRQAAPGGFDCSVQDGQEQDEECGIDACIITFDPHSQQRTYSGVFPQKECGDGSFNSPVSWCSNVNQYGAWTEVDLLHSVRVMGISTKGRHDYPQWVKEYEAKVSNNGINDWNPVVFAGGKKEVEGNIDQDTVNTQMFEEPIQTRYVRVYPKTFYGQMSMRFGVLIEKTTQMLLQERRCVSWGDPHYTDWNGHVFDYFGWDDQLLAVFDNIRVETDNIGWGGQDRNNPNRPTIQQTITIVTPNGKTIEVQIDNKLYLDCKPWTTIENNVNGEIVDDLRVRTHYLPDVKRKIITINTPHGLIYIQVNDKQYIDITIAVTGEKEASHITGGLCTGRPANELTNGPNGLNGFPSISWDATPSPALPNQNAINAMGKSWELTPATSHVCKSLVKTNRLGTLNKAVVTPAQITDEVKQQAQECCKPIKDRQIECGLDDRIFKSCVVDHENAYKSTMKVTCQNLEYLNELCKKHSSTLQLQECIGAWSDWSECRLLNGKCEQQRKYIIVRPAIHNGVDCAFKHNELQSQLCPTESCVEIFNPLAIYNPPKKNYEYSSNPNGANDGSFSSASAATLNNAKDEYVEIDLKHIVPVFGIITKGNAKAEEWVKHFGVQISVNGKLWKQVKNAKNEIIFTGNVDKNTEVRNIFKKQVNAVLIRIIPEDWNGANSMRVGIVMDSDIVDLLNQIQKVACPVCPTTTTNINALGHVGQPQVQGGITFNQVTKGLENVSLYKRVVKHLSVPVIIGTLSVFVALVAIVGFLVLRRRHNPTQVEYVWM